MLIKQGKTNLKYLLIVIILAVIVGGGILGYQYWLIPEEEPKIPAVKPLQREHWITYTQEELIRDDLGRTFVRVKSLTLYNPDTKEKKILIPDLTKKYSTPISFLYLLRSPDGKSLLIEISDRPQSILDITTGLTQELPKVEGFDIFWYSNNELAFFSERREESISILKYSLFSEEISELGNIPKPDNVEDTADLRDFSLSPDKEKVIYASFPFIGPTNIYLFDLKNRETKQLTHSGGDTSPRWLNEEMIIFKRRDAEDDSVWILNINSDESQMLIGSEEGVDSNTVFRYTFVTDGRKIIYPAYLTKQGQDIYSIEISSRQIVKIFHLPYLDFTNAQVSNDYKYLLYSSLVGPKRTLREKKIFLYEFERKKETTICEPTLDYICGKFELY